MQAENYRFGGGTADTIFHPLVAVAVVLAIPLMLGLRRKSAIVPFLLVALLTPLGQVMVLGGVHFMVPRMLILFASLRVLHAKFTSKEPVFAGGLINLDKVFFTWAICEALAFMLLNRDTSAAINQCGFLLDTVGGYCICRFLIRDSSDIVRVVKVLAFVVGVLGVTMVIEQRTQTNIFGLLGGVAVAPAIREGRIRSQGVFQHAILAGAFGATVLPLFLWLWKYGKSKVLAAIGFIGSGTMVLTSASSTPVLAYLGGLLALFLWPVRAKMRPLRWAIVLVICALALVMDAPVWFIVAHIDVVGSSSGYHRAMLIDQFVRHFSDWWLLGSNNNETWGWDMWDVQNQFIAEGETGGLLAFVLFIALISLAFKRIGLERIRQQGDQAQQWLMWALGAVLFSHVVAFFGANYFDQTKFWWLAFLAMVAAATAAHSRPAEAPVEVV